MSQSANETEALARKAARGAGISWGLAEDTGRAVRWLETRGFAGAAALADYLGWRDDGGQIAQLEVHSGLWRGADGPLCPIAVGTYMSDAASESLPAELMLVSLRQPLLIIPFAAWAVEIRQQAMTLECDEATLWLGADGSVAGRDVALASEADVSLRHTKMVPDALRCAPKTRCAPSKAALKTLDRFASRTYAPATKASRLAGAGAGTTDND